MGARSRRHYRLDLRYNATPATVTAPTTSGPSEALHGALDRIPEASLPQLPDISRLDVQQPTAEDVQELEAKLGALFSDERDSKEVAVGELLEVRPRVVAAIHVRLAQMAERDDKEKMKRILNEARRQSKSELHSPGHDLQSSARQADQDLLMLLLRSDKPKDQTWRECVNLMAQLRMLSAMATVEAARELVFAYARFGEFVFDRRYSSGYLK